MRRSIQLEAPLRSRAAGFVAAALLAAPAIASAATFVGATVPAQTDTASSKGVAPVKLSCPAHTTGCKGRLVLKSDRPVKPQNRVVTLGSQSFSIASGTTATVRVKLSSQGFSLLKSQGKLTPIATATTNLAGGGHASSSRKITLKKHASGSTQGSQPTGLY